MNISKILSYGAGQSGWAAKDTCFQYFLFFYYTQYLGLSPSLAGLGALLAIIADAISDPLVGHISDSTSSPKWGRRHQYMLLSIVPFCISLVAVFNPPEGLSDINLFFWYLVMSISVRTCLTFFVIPHMSLGAELSADFQERTKISALRVFCGYFAGIALQCIAWFVLIPNATAAGQPAEGYSAIGYYAAGLAGIGMLISVWGTFSTIGSLPKSSVAQQQRRWYLAFYDIVTLFRLPSARWMLLGSVVLVTAIGISNTMLLHVNLYFYGFSSAQTGIFILSVMLSLFPATWLAMYGGRVFGKAKAIMIYLGAIAILLPVPVLLKLYDIAPASGSNGLMVFVCSFVVVQQSFFIAVLNLKGSMIGDIADELELSNNMRQEGIINSAMMLVQKMTFGFGAFAAGLMIEYTGVTKFTTAADVSTESLTRLAMCFGPGVAIIIAFSILFFSKYKLDYARYLQVRSELDQRRALA